MNARERWHALQARLTAARTLKPVNPDFEPIVLTGDEGELQIIAELVEVL